MDLIAFADAGYGGPVRAVLCDRFDGIAALRMGETAEPAMADDEILIDVHAASVSYMDYLMASGGYQMRPALPYVPGTDAAGVVVAVGDKAERFRPGDRVACGNWFGGFAERMVAKASKSARIPDNVDFFVGSTILHAYLTAWYALVDRVRLQPGETVLITGAAGGVGLACVEVARLVGGRVIAALFLSLARLMRWNGRLIPMGFTGGEIPSVPMNLPLLKNYSIVGVFAGAWMTNFPDESAEAADKVMALVGEGALHPRVDRVLPLEQASEAMRAVAERSVQGRMVLRVR
jgi:NADPH:quinone reductase